MGDGFVNRPAAFAGAGSGKARETRGERRTSAYAAGTRDEAQRGIRNFYEAVILINEKEG